MTINEIFKQKRNYSIGVEEEFMICDPDSGLLIDKADEIMSAVKEKDRYSYELLLSEIERSFSTMLPVPAVVIVKSALEGAVNVEPIEVISAKSSFVANSSAVAPALTLSTWPAEPIDKDAPVPPLAKLIKSAD